MFFNHVHVFLEQYLRHMVKHTKNKIIKKIKQKQNSNEIKKEANKLDIKAVQIQKSVQYCYTAIA